MVEKHNLDEFRVVSYNILTQKLVSETKLPNCDPKYIQEDFRRNLLQKVLESEVKQRSIICLQEVNTEWASWLYTWFDLRNYYFINTQYSKSFNGYMGTSIAISRDKFLLDELKFLRPFKNTYVQKPAFFTSVASMFTKFAIPALVIAPIVAFARRRFSNGSWSDNAFLEKSLPFYLCGASILAAQVAYNKAFPELGVFHSTKLEEGISARHRDTIPMVKLKPGNSAAFWVASVHMPCKHWNSKLMTAFACNIAKTVQSQAGNSRYILAGDFNAKPQTDDEPSGVYELYVNGVLGCEHPHFPVVAEGWEPKLQHPMVSAYRAVDGKEPELTTYANWSWAGFFANTIDYIWLSPGWEVVSVDPLIGLDGIQKKCKSLPCQEYMSDHFMLAANLKMAQKKQL